MSMLGILVGWSADDSQKCLAGWLWDQWGPEATFYGGAVLSLLALAGLGLRRLRAT